MGREREGGTGGEGREGERRRGREREGSPSAHFSSDSEWFLPARQGARFSPPTLGLQYSALLRTPLGWFLPPPRPPPRPAPPGAGGSQPPRPQVLSMAAAAAAEAREWKAPGRKAPDELTARPPWGKQGFPIHLPSEVEVSAPGEEAAPGIRLRPPAECGRPDRPLLPGGRGGCGGLPPPGTREHSGPTSLACLTEAVTPR